MKVYLDILSEYALRMERTGSSPCYIDTKHLRLMIEELKAARKVVEAVRDIVDELEEDELRRPRYSYLADTLKELGGEK